MADDETAVECPVCLGEGGFGLRDSNALLAEHLTDAELALFVGGLDAEWWTCDECGGSGLVDARRAADIAGWAAARVDQALAEFTRREST